jgi:hypothetical protein
MFHGPTSGIHPFVILCKGCQQNILAPVQTLPDSWIVADCPLCGEKRRYLPADIFRGRLSHDLLAKSRRIEDRRWKMGEMKRAVVREERERARMMEEQKRMTDRFASTLVIAASIIAAVRLAREQDISRPSPRLHRS